MMHHTWLANERQFLVDYSFAAFERQGGVITPSMRQLYARYVRGELSLTGLLNEVEARAEQVKVHAAHVFLFL